MNNRQRIMFVVISLFLIILVITGLTYAYFLTKVKGNSNDKSISITTANLLLEYGDGNGFIDISGLEPGESVRAKTFTVTNQGDTFVEDYVVYLEKVINNFYNGKDVTYSVSCQSVDKETLETKGTCKGVSNVIFPRKNDVVLTNDIDVGIMHKYSLTVKYAETNTDQSRDMNKNVTAKVDIYDRREKIKYLIDENSMLDFVNKMGELETLAVDYLGDDATSTGNSDYYPDKTKWLVFSTISKLSYNTNNWTEVAGPEDTKFLEYLEQNNFDINYFKDLKYVASGSGATSSVTHLSAAIAANIYNTDALYNIVLDEIHYNNLAGWAGDLQTLISNNLISQVTDLNNYNEVYNKMSELIGASGTYFDSDDLYADIDALNIYRNLSSSKSIRDVLKEYFSTKYQGRYATFIKNIATALDYDELSDNIYIYTQYKNSGVTWPLYNNISEFPSTVAIAARDAFTDYLWYIANLDSLNIYSESLEFKKGTNVQFYTEYININRKIDDSLTNEDYVWTVTNNDGSACLSTIDNGMLSINENETANKLLIKVVLKKSSKVVSTKIINVA